MCHQNVTETQATESTHREAGLAISMLHTGLSSARCKEADESEGSATSNFGVRDFLISL